LFYQCDGTLQTLLGERFQRDKQNVALYFQGVSEQVGCSFVPGPQGREGEEKNPKQNKETQSSISSFAHTTVCKPQTRNTLT